MRGRIRHHLAHFMNPSHRFLHHQVVHLLLSLDMHQFSFHNSLLTTILHHLIYHPLDLHHLVLVLRHHQHHHQLLDVVPELEIYQENGGKFLNHHQFYLLYQILTLMMLRLDLLRYSLLVQLVLQILAPTNRQCKVQMHTGGTRLLRMSFCL
jgi:hypothetical protein